MAVKILTSDEVAQNTNLKFKKSFGSLQVKLNLRTIVKKTPLKINTLIHISK